MRKMFNHIRVLGWSHQAHLWTARSVFTARSQTQPRDRVRVPLLYPSPRTCTMTPHMSLCACITAGIKDSSSLPPLPSSPPPSLRGCLCPSANKPPMWDLLHGIIWYWAACSNFGAARFGRGSQFGWTRRICPDRFMLLLQHGVWNPLPRGGAAPTRVMPTCLNFILTSQLATQAHFLVIGFLPFTQTQAIW